MELLAVLVSVALFILIQNIGAYEIKRRKNRIPFVLAVFIDEVLLSIQEACLIGAIIIMFHGFQYFADKAQ